MNKTAAVVTGKGIHYEPDVNIVNAHWDVPQATIRCPKPSDELAGRRFARFVVVGLLPTKIKNSNANWLVRCACGDYETRKAKAIRNPANVDDCCTKCKYLRYLKRREVFLREKKWPS